jgi:hypothetical protein
MTPSGVGQRRAVLGDVEVVLEEGQRDIDVRAIHQRAKQ